MSVYCRKGEVYPDYFHCHKTTVRNQAEKCDSGDTTDYTFKSVPNSNSKLTNDLSTNAHTKLLEPPLPEEHKLIRRPK